MTVDVRGGLWGLAEAGSHFARWMGMLPSEITSHIEMLMIPGSPSSGGTDNASFICAGAPAFGLFATRWNYFTYTWHTELDTFDKVVFDDLMNNAHRDAGLSGRPGAGDDGARPGGGDPT